MFRNLFILIFLCLSWLGLSQDYESYVIGNTTDVDTQPNFGICLMGGAQEDDNAMQWFLNRADGGDVVVIRTSGSNAYNNYFFNELGVTINSVETLVINNEDGATDPYVLDKVANAEAIWFAGGNQATYVNYFKDNAFMDLLNAHVNVKQAPIGGTSAGMAIMSEFYFDAINGSVTSVEALNDPFHNSVSIGQGSFLDFPFLENTITDTHYDNPDRKGRHIAFLSRIVDETGERAFGIAAEEFVGICIDQDGEASVFGEFPNFDDFAYFIQVNCVEDFIPEQFSADTPLTWNLNNEAIKAYKIPGTATGNNSFDVYDWESGNGGSWEHWWVENGNLETEIGTAIDCESLNTVDFENKKVHIYPNPFTHRLYVDFPDELIVTSVTIFDLNGRKYLFSKKVDSSILQVEDLPTGIYFLQLQTNQGVITEKLIKN